MSTPATATAVAPAGRPCRRKRPAPHFQRYSYQSLRPPVRVAFPELHAAPVGVAVQRHAGAAFFHTERLAHHGDRGPRAFFGFGGVEDAAAAPGAVEGCAFFRTLFGRVEDSIEVSL